MPVIHDFEAFGRELTDLFERVREKKEGAVATYIPQLARVDPEGYGAAVCTIDGMKWSTGDATADFTAQSTMKPINYCIAVEELGIAQVHDVVGREPSGRGFNVLTLNHENRPHNPMINAGAIAVADRLIGLFGDTACAALTAFMSDLAGEPIRLRHRGG